VNHLGVLLKQQGRLQEAEELLTRALNGFEESLGTNHLCTAEAAYNYAVLSVQVGKRRKAASLFGKSHRGLAEALGVEHQHTLDALHWELKCQKSFEGLPPLAEGADEPIFESKKTWVNVAACEICSTTYTMMRRAHHCRICSRSTCHECSPNKTIVLEFDSKAPVRVCSICEQQGF